MSNPHTAHSTQSTSDKNYELRTTNYELTEPLTSHLATHHSPPRPVRSTCPDNCLTPVGASRGGHIVGRLWGYGLTRGAPRAGF